MGSFRYFIAGFLLLFAGFFFLQTRLFFLGILMLFASFVFLTVDRIKLYSTEKKLDASNALEQFINLKRMTRLERFAALIHDALVILFAFYIGFVIKLWVQEGRFVFNFFTDPSGREILKIVAVGGVVALVIEGGKK